MQDIQGNRSQNDKKREQYNFVLLKILAFTKKVHQYERNDTIRTFHLAFHTERYG